MSDRYPSYAVTWHQCSAKVQSVLDKHSDRLLDIDLKIVYPLIRARNLLEPQEEDQVCDACRATRERITLLITYVCRKGVNHRNGQHGIEAFIECLRESGDTHGQPGHTALADDMTKDLQGELYSYSVHCRCTYTCTWKYMCIAH